jgi:hypothetical protein
VLRATKWTESLRDLVATTVETNLTVQAKDWLWPADEWLGAPAQVPGASIGALQVPGLCAATGPA